jgi:hypothetical protein
VQLQRPVRLQEERHTGVGLRRNHRREIIKSRAKIPLFAEEGNFRQGQTPNKNYLVSVPEIPSSPPGKRLGDIGLMIVD